MALCISLYCCVVFCTIFVFFTNAGHACRYSPLLVVIQPEHNAIKEGQHAIFDCSVTNANCKTDSLSWLVTPNSPLIAPESSCDDNNLTSRLIIQNMDSNIRFVTCHLDVISQSSSGTPLRQCFSSQSAKLLVQYFPTAEQLTCEPRGPQEVRVGESQGILCEVPRGEPAVDLSWRIDPPTSLQHALPWHHEDGTYRVLSHEILFTQDLDLSKIICEVSSATAFPGQRHQCIIGPFRVISQPNVFVYPKQALLPITSPIQLLCIAKGYPENYIYSWFCSPGGVLNGCNGHSQTADVSYNRSLSSMASGLVEVLVACTVTNTEGSDTETALISLDMDNFNDSDDNDQDIHPPSVAPVTDLSTQSPASFGFAYSTQENVSTSYPGEINVLLTSENIPNVSGTVPTAKVKSDSNQTSFSHMWQTIISAVSGTVATIFATACIIRAIYVCFHKKTKRDPEITSPKQDDSGGAQAEHVEDTQEETEPVYTDPPDNDPSLSNIPPNSFTPNLLISSGLEHHHLYDTNVYRSSGRSTSSELYTYSSSSSESDLYDESCKAYDAQSICSEYMSMTVEYENSAVIRAAKWDSL